jgi:hypothetical protein
MYHKSHQRTRGIIWNRMRAEQMHTCWFSQLPPDCCPLLSLFPSRDRKEKKNSNPIKWRIHHNLSSVLVFLFFRKQTNTKKTNPDFSTQNQIFFLLVSFVIRLPLYAIVEKYFLINENSSFVFSTLPTIFVFASFLERKRRKKERKCFNTFDFVFTSREK